MPPHRETRPDWRPGMLPTTLPWYRQFAVKVAHRLLRRSPDGSVQARAPAAPRGSRCHGPVRSWPTGSVRTEAFVTLSVRRAR